MSAAHTPTPWSTDGRSVRGKDNERGNGALLFEVDGYEGDAEFIVRAVNSHDELVAALNLVLDVVASCHRCWELSADDEEKAQVEAALAKAEGRS